MTGHLRHCTHNVIAASHSAVVHLPFSRDRALAADHGIASCRIDFPAAVAGTLCLCAGSAKWRRASVQPAPHDAEPTRRAQPSRAGTRRVPWRADDGDAAAADCRAADGHRARSRPAANHAGASAASNGSDAASRRPGASVAGRARAGAGFASPTRFARAAGADAGPARPVSTCPISARPISACPVSACPGAARRFPPAGSGSARDPVQPLAVDRRGAARARCRTGRALAASPPPATRRRGGTRSRRAGADADPRRPDTPRRACQATAGRSTPFARVTPGRACRD